MATPLQTNTDKLTALKEKANNLPDQNPPASLQEKTVTPTKEGLSVAPDSGFDGLSKVTVNGDNNLVPENIKEGVSIFGISGALTNPKYYKITYNLNYGQWNTDYTPPTTMYLSGEKVLLPNRTELTGNKGAAFNGWVDEETGEVLPQDIPTGRYYIPETSSKDYRIRAEYI